MSRFAKRLSKNQLNRILRAIVVVVSQNGVLRTTCRQCGLSIIVNGPSRLISHQNPVCDDFHETMARLAIHTLHRN